MLDGNYRESHEKWQTSGITRIILYSTGEDEVPGVMS